MNGAFQGGGGGSPGLGGGIFNLAPLLSSMRMFTLKIIPPAVQVVWCQVLLHLNALEMRSCSPVVGTGGNYGSINFAGGDGGLTSNSTTLAT